jgi:hypothetical protein
MEDTRGWLPVGEFDGTQFFVDVESREFRDVDDPENVVDMHSEEGRRMVEEMAGMEWRVFRVDNQQAKASEV